jgi:hypothetical protein
MMNNIYNKMLKILYIISYIIYMVVYLLKILYYNKLSAKAIQRS